MNGFICKRLAVKIGSNVLTRKDGTLDVTRMSAIVDQVAELYKSGVEIILVSSGAVAAKLNHRKDLTALSNDNSFLLLGKQNSSTDISNCSANMALQ